MPTASSNSNNATEGFTAWERWTPGVLNETPQPRREQESRDAIVRRAHAAGFAEGKQAGFEAGRAEGLALAQAEAAHIATIAAAAQDSLRALGDTLSRKTLALAVAIAQKIVQREIQSCPDGLLDIVRNALTLVPDDEQRVRIMVNSADLALVRDALPQESNLSQYTVVGSDDIARGGCRIVSPSGDVDATLQTRMSRVLEALGAMNTQPDQPR